MAKLSSVTFDKRGQNAMVYGPPKSGKTYLVGTLANEGYRLWWFDLERGAATLQLAVDPDKQDNVNLLQIPDMPDDPVAIKTITNVFAAANEVKICETHGRVGCVDCSKDEKAEYFFINPSQFTEKDIIVIDSLSQLSDSAMTHAVGKRQQMVTKKAEWDHYSAQGMLLTYVLQKAQAAPYHTIFISHEESVEQEDGSEKITPVGGTRNFSKKIGRYFDHVVYCTTKNKKHSANSSTTYNAKILTGSRAGIALEEGHKFKDLFNPNSELLAAAKAEIEKAAQQKPASSILKKT